MRKLSINSGILILSFFLIVGATGSKTAKAMPAADFYAKETVTVVVPYGAGGGVDYLARLFSSYWPEVVPGGTMKVKNVTGAAGIRGTNYIYAARPDGLTIGVSVFAGSMIAPPLWKAPGVEFDPAKFIYLGAVSKDPFMFSISSKLPYKSIEEMKGVKGFKFAGIERYGQPSLGAALIAKIFQFEEPKIIVGYGGTKEVGLSVGRGETDGYVLAAASTVQDIAAGYVKKPLVVLDTTRTKWFPDVPALTELTQLSPKIKIYFDIFVSMAEGRPFFMPPGVPQDKVQFMRDAFNKIINLKGFQRQAKYRWPVWEEPLSGEAAQALISSVMNVPEEDVAAYKKLADEYIQ
jgi:tripartite-type tricarboxylate transporter receptor subunit TctC